MFYSFDVLAKKGKFALIWMAVNKGGKLSKGECQRVDIPKTVNDLCAYIPTKSSTSTERKFSLYLCSQLTLGLVYIFEKQMTYLLGDLKDLNEHMRHPLKFGVVEKRRGKAVQIAAAAIAQDDAQLQMSHSSGGSEHLLDGGSLWNKDLATDGAVLGEYMNDFQQMSDDIVIGSSTDYSGDPVHGPGAHQARVEEITLRENAPAAVNAEHNDLLDDDLLPINDAEWQLQEAAAHLSLAQTPHGRALLEHIGTGSGHQTPQTHSSSSGASAPNAPPRSLTPPRDEPNQTNVQAEEEPLNLPSIGMRLDSLSPPPPPEKPAGRKRRESNLETEVTAKRRHRVPLTAPLFIRSALLKEQQLNYDDIVCADEAERARLNATHDKKRNARPKAADLLKPGRSAWASVADLRAQAADPFGLQSRLPMDPALLQLWAALKDRQTGETPRGWEDINNENPFAEPLMDENFLATPQADVSLLLDELEVGRDGTDVSANLLDSRRGRPSSRLSSIPKGANNTDGPFADAPTFEDAFVPMVPQDEGAALEPISEVGEVLDMGDVWRCEAGLGGVLAELEELALAQYGEEEAGVAFEELCPPADTTRPKAAKYFYSLLQLAKQRCVSFRQDSLEDDISIRVLSN